MSVFRIPVEDSSPLIAYTPSDAWKDSTNDPLQATYQGESFHFTSTPGAAASFTFNGTAVRIFGGCRPGYGTFTISVDGQILTRGDSNRPSNATRQLLGAASGLNLGPHTVVYTSNGDGGIDLDWIEFETQVGSSGSKVDVLQIDDTDPRVVYSSSPSSWRTTTSPDFLNNSIHFTDQPSASALMTFTGDAIAIYGSVSPDHADMQFSIDGQERVLPGGVGRSSAFHPKVLMYFANQLGQGEHQLVLTAAPRARGSFVDVDSMVVFQVSRETDLNGAAAIPPSGISSADVSPNDPSTRNSIVPKRAPVPVPIRGIVGAVIGGVAIFVLTLGLVLFFVRRRRQPRSAKNVLESLPMSPELPMQKTPTMAELGMNGSSSKPAIGFTEFLTSRQGFNSVVDRHLIAPTNYGLTNGSESIPTPLSRSSSAHSTMPMLPVVPLLKLPQPPRRTATAGGTVPMRPKRPPTLNFLS